MVGDEHKRHLAILRQKIPEEFMGRRMVDLGCGDGINTLRLMEIFRPSSVMGFDLHPGLVRQARKRKVEAYQADLEEVEIKGELGVLWGTLHHMQNPKDFLMRLKKNFDYLFIREKVSRVFFELGRPFSKEELLGLCQEVLGEIGLIEYRGREHLLFIFYKKK